MPTYLRKRGKNFHFRKRIPLEFRELFKDDVIQVPLKTDSLIIAKQRASSFDLILNDFWRTLEDKNKDQAQQELKDICLKAKKYGFQYVQKQELVSHISSSEFLNRINLAISLESQKEKEIVLGGAEEPKICLSEALQEFFTYEEGNLKGWSEDQVRKWKNPRKRALNNFIKIIGDKSLEDITRKDVLDFRTWWVERVNAVPPKSPNSANKEFGFIKKVVETTVNNHLLDVPIDQLFKKIRLKDIDKNSRSPFETKFIKTVLLNPKVISLNEEAHLFIYAMCDTGARIGELTGLEDNDIVLNADIPHIKIRPNQTRKLKTPQSERNIPLVGTSLYAFQKLGGRFKHYFGKSDLLSTAINKYFRDNDILPSRSHSLYSLRHSFEDRLTAVEPPDKLQAALMGHKYYRPRYGLGPTLEQKRLWLDKIAIKC